MNKIWRWILGILFLAAVTAFFVYLFTVEKEKPEAEIISKTEDTGDAGREIRLPVKTVVVERGELPLRMRISGVADSHEKSVLKAEVSGYIEEIHCRVGDQVKAGQEIVILNDREKRIELESARANRLKNLGKFLVTENDSLYRQEEIEPEKKVVMEEKKNSYLAALESFRLGRSSAADLEKAKHDYEASLVYSGELREEIRKAEIGLTDAVINEKKAEWNLERTRIRSPFHATVANLRLSRGEQVSAGQEVLSLVNLRKLFVRGYALESEISRLGPGVKVRIGFDAFPGDYVYGSITALAPEVDADKKTVTVYVDFDNPESRFFPGMHAEMDVEYQVLRDVLKVPRNAVIHRQERPLVFVVRDETAFWVYVELGERNEEEFAIIGGELAAGDQVIVEGHLTLGHQARVQVVK